VSDEYTPGSMATLYGLAKRVLMELLLTVPICLAMVYVSIGLFAWLLSDRLIFPAPPSSYSDTDWKSYGIELLRVPTVSGETVAAVYLPNRGARDLLLYSHGNAEDLGSTFPTLQAFHQAGFAVFAYDYPGYGTSEGRPSEASAIAAIDGAYDFLTDDLSVPSRSIIAYGRSLGSGPVIDLASRRKLGGVILEGAFVSAFRVMTHIPILPWDKFANLGKMEDVSCPVLVIHAMEDEVIPFWHGRAIHERANTPKFYLWVENAGHNNLREMAGQTYLKSIRALQKEIGESAL
jgi:fermentation-respiration switch protein FrsA (DUF1100 family)